MWSFNFFLTSIMLGVGLAMDAFSVSLANGLNEPKMKRKKMGSVAFVFAFCKKLLECLPAYDTICLDSGADDFNEFIDVIKRGGCFNQ